MGDGGGYPTEVGAWGTDHASIPPGNGGEAPGFEKPSPMTSQCERLAFPNRRHGVACQLHKAFNAESETEESAGEKRSRICTLDGSTGSTIPAPRAEGDRRQKGKTGARPLFIRGGESWKFTGSGQILDNRNRARCSRFRSRPRCAIMSEAARENRVVRQNGNGRG